jgi:hypothetical protein
MRNLKVIQICSDNHYVGRIFALREDGKIFMSYGETDGCWEELPDVSDETVLETIQKNKEIKNAE